MWAVAPVIPRCGPDKMRHRIQSENQFGRFNIKAINIEIIRPVNLGSMQLRAADEKMNQPIRKREARIPHVLQQVTHETSNNIGIMPPAYILGIESSCD